VPDGFDVATSSFLEDPDGGNEGFVILEANSGRYDEAVAFYEKFASSQEGVTRTESTSDLTRTVGWLLDDSNSSIGVLTEDDKTIVTLTYFSE
jgi:hypothetical protein